MGQDLGFDATWLRILFAVGLFWNFTAVIAAYLGLGVVMLVARRLTPVSAEGVAPRRSAEAANNEEVELKRAA